MKLKFSFFLCLLLPLFTFARIGDVTYKRTITKEFTVSAGAVFNVSNKYGKVIFHTWNKNEIKAVIAVTGFGKTDTEAQGIAEMVEIDAEQNGGEVALRTRYNPTKSGSSWFSWSNGRRDSKEYVNIDYDVYIPQSLARLKVSNQFGDVLADRLNFPAEMALSYCTFDIREAEDLNLRISYCDKGKIGKAGKVNIQSSYSKVRADQVSAWITSSSYSDFEIGNATDVQFDVTYGDAKFEKVGNLSGKVTFTDIKILELLESINYKGTYADIKVNKVATSLKNAEFVLTYSDLRMNVARRQPLQLQAKMVNGDLKTGGLDLKNVVSNKSTSSLSYTAQAGGGSEQSPRIIIKGVQSDAKLDVY
ncbi:hypothetical protein [Chitinophaga solisilvae]|uniref:hypothetical protein n=1 Tax=Chitinophaga solisilvae TaxID=1233460 RepID=UPI00136FC45B|nr:hypothetical protein [Chitinophaga solisilvae]